ncbi:MAG TPA: penicillin-binding protein 2 [Clostridia bacterium]|nr:penicillin-binding protein 2 [Clostridia bacterium]
MGKRVVYIFFIFSLVMGIATLRLIDINQSEYAQVGQINSSISISINQGRGEIYDCNMKKLVNTQVTYYAAAKPSALALSALEPYVTASELASITDRMSSGHPVCIKVPVSHIDCEDVTVISTYSRYSENQTAVHLIGHLDGTSNGVLGIEKSFNNHLSSASKKCYVNFPVDARGRVLAGGKVTVKNSTTSQGRGVVTTLNKDIQSIAENAMKEYNIISGAAVVLETKTGEIKAMVSMPAFNPSRVADYLDNENSPFINKSLTAYSAGSVFKCVIAAAAVEQRGLEDYRYNCTGSTSINSIVFNCHKDEGHGLIDFYSAVAHSCNTYFINLAQNIEKETLLRVAQGMGFGTETVFAEGIVSSSGNLPKLSELDSAAAVANLSFGQGSLLTTPIQIAQMTQCIANNGKLIRPTLINSLVDDNLKVIQEKPKIVPEIVISAETANKVKDMLVYTIDYGSGKNAKPKNSTAGGKTATAQTGIYENGKELLNTWFSGFFPAENPKYVITIMKEKGRSGSTDCTPVFKQIAEQIIELEKNK